MNKKMIKVGSVLMALSVILGAITAHVLEKHLTEKMLKTFETAARYQTYHSLGIILCGILTMGFDLKKINWVYKLFLIGIILFSGSLYALSLLSLTGNESFKMLGAITPFGGLCFIIGWIYLAIILSKLK